MFLGSVGASLVLGYYRAITKFQVILKKIALLTSLQYRSGFIFCSNENGPKTDSIKITLQGMLLKDVI